MVLRKLKLAATAPQSNRAPPANSKGPIPKETPMVVIAPSILSADFARLGEQVVESEQGGAGRVHIDVMDGHFVPNLSLGPAVVGSLRRVTRLPLEVHLMVQEPERFVDPFLAKGADSLIAHLEVLPDPRPFVRRLHDAGKR